MRRKVSHNPRRLRSKDRRGLIELGETAVQYGCATRIDAETLEMEGHHSPPFSPLSHDWLHVTHDSPHVTHDSRNLMSASHNLMHDSHHLTPDLRNAMPKWSHFGMVSSSSSAGSTTVAATAASTILTGTAPAAAPAVSTTSCHFRMASELMQKISAGKSRQNDAQVSNGGRCF